MNIQWYPGHMTKAKRAMQEDVKIVDMIIELVDARAPMSTRNPDIDTLGQGKARIIIMNKYDLADPSISKQWEKYFTDNGFECIGLDSRARAALKALLNKIDIAATAKRERDKKRGILNRPVRAMVVGIPNVGKSTLINTIAGRSIAKTGNKPGVTKGNQWIRLNKNVELLDTPGILWPKFDDEAVGERIAMLGSVNDMILDIGKLACLILDWMKNNKEDELAKRYELSLESLKDTDNYKLLEAIAIFRGCISKGGASDIEKAAGAVVNDFRSGKLGRVTLELPNN